MYACDYAVLLAQCFSFFFFCKMKNCINNLLLKLTGAVAGVYVGAEYGVERIRGRRDWVRLLYLLVVLYMSKLE